MSASDRYTAIGVVRDKPDGPKDAVTIWLYLPGDGIESGALLAVGPSLDAAKAAAISELEAALAEARTAEEPTP
jgi:hypothetical protein